MSEPAPRSAPPDVVAPIVDGLIDAGARAVWLAGSHARGEATRHSDIDISALGDDATAGPGYRLERAGGHLLSIAWTTAEATRASFANPAVLGAAVAGWRAAVILHDPGGMAAALRAEALAWRWEHVADRADAWVAEQIAGYAEEVHKLVGALEAGEPLRAAVQRGVLATRLAVVLSVHRRILYDSENVLWDLVADAEGARWRAAQGVAFALARESPREASAAALTLYLLAADAAASLFDDRQRAVVEHAVTIAGEAIATTETRA